MAVTNEVLCKFLRHNSCVVHQSHIELGIKAEFWRKEEAPCNGPDVLPMSRPS